MKPQNTTKLGTVYVRGYLTCEKSIKINELLQRQIMNFRSIISPLVVCLCANVFSQENRNDEVLAMSYERIDHRGFFVKLNQLNAYTSWNPDTETFPLSLGKEARNTLAFFANGGITNQIDINEITISRIFVPNELANRNEKMTSFYTNQWGVGFQALLQFSNFSNVFSVVLLNGTRAIERTTNPSSESDTNLKTSETNTSHSFKDLKAEPGTNQLSKNPLQELFQADFEIPRIQWDPSYQEFPLDLALQARRAKAFLSDQKAIKMERLSLLGVTMMIYVPLESIRVKGLRQFDNRYHWFVKFTYEEQGTDFITIHDVYMLLDGRFLQN